MKPAATLLFLAIILQSPWASQDENGKYIAMFKEIYEYFSNLLINTPRYEAEQKILEILASQAQKLGIESKRQQVQIPGEFWMDAESIQLISPGDQEGLIGIHLDLFFPEIHGSHSKTAFSAALAWCWMLRMAESTQRRSVSLAILGAQYAKSGNATALYGSRALLYAQQGFLPNHVWHFQLKGPGSDWNIDLEQHGSGISGGEFSRLFMTIPSKHLQGKLFLSGHTPKSAYSLTNPYANYNIPRIIIKNESTENQEAYEFNPLALFDAMSIANTSSVGRHFIAFFYKKLFIIDESGLLYLVVLSGLAYSVLLVSQRQRMRRAWNAFCSSSGDFFIYLFILAACVLVVWALVAVTRTYFASSAWSEDHPGIGFLAILCASTGLFALAGRSPLRKAMVQLPAAHGFISHILFSLPWLVLCMFSILAVPFTILVLFASFPMSDYRKRFVAFIKTILCGIPSVLSILLLYQENFYKEVFSSIVHNALLCLGASIVLLMPFLSGFMANLSTNPFQEAKKQKRKILLILTGIATLVIFAFYNVMQSVFPPAPAHLSLDYKQDAPGNAYIEWTSSRPLTQATLMLGSQTQILTGSTGSFPSKSSMPPAPQFMISKQDIESRQRVQITIVNAQDVQDLSILCTASTAYTIEYSKNYFTLLSPSQSIFHLGSHPRQGILCSFDIEGRLSGKLEATWVQNDFPADLLPVFNEGSITTRSSYKQIILQCL